MENNKSKLILGLALVWTGIFGSVSANAADTNTLRVVVIPSKTEVRVKEQFKVALRVENPTATNQIVRVWSCSWEEEWKCSNTNIFLVAVSVTKVVNPQFTVSIVGQRQLDQSQYDKGGLSIVICPKVASTLPTGMFDQPSENCFFVVIQNTQKVADGITMCLSEWYDCLQFKIIDASGKIYSVAPAPMDWSANILETWTFPIGGMRVMAVDFTSAAMVGQCPGWQGLPPVPSAPELVTMTATFRYYDPAGKPIYVSSKPTAVYLVPK